MQFILFLFCLFAIFLPISSIGCSQEECCWRSCFDSSRTVGRELDYAQLYQVLETVRGAQASYGIRGTVYGFDKTANDANVRTLQRNLAAILALVQPVTNQDNPIFISSYFKSGSSADLNCLHKCSAFRYLEQINMRSQTFFEGSGTGDYAGMSCYVGRLTNTFPWSCRAGNENKMVIIFANSPVNSQRLTDCFLYDVGVAIRISGDSQLLPFAGVPTTANLFQLDLQATSSLASTSGQLKSCVRQCNGCLLDQRKKRDIVNEEEEGGDEFLTAKKLKYPVAWWG